ncbi:hypothetical protein HZ326_5081 [Fusarium oxysporum f. sp. albedinis]|nr:hypothetical protein HZ326_5081 [Fusarium oxysporum f. sp. albedinis]
MTGESIISSPNILLLAPIDLIVVLDQFLPSLPDLQLLKFSSFVTSAHACLSLSLSTSHRHPFARFFLFHLCILMKLDTYHRCRL